MASSKNDSEQSSSEHSKSSSEQHDTKYRLHIYDHCPYCIRVELAFGLRNFEYERVLYGYGDRLGDKSIKMLENPHMYDTGVVLTGKKELPVLEKTIQITSDNSDGNITSTTTRVWLKNESLDMIEWLEEQGGNDTNTFQPRSNRDDLKEFFKTDGLFKVIQRLITRPRQMKNMTYLKDWMKVEDRQYAIAKYESQGFDYTEAVANDQENVAKMTVLLNDCNTKLLKSNTSFYENGILGWDDLLYLQELRTVSLVHDDNLIWPDRLKNYVISSFAQANNVPTYFKE